MNNDKVTGGSENHSYAHRSGFTFLFFPQIVQVVVLEDLAGARRAEYISVTK